MASFFLSPESDRYYAGRAFVYGGRQYTKAGATRATFEGLNFTEITINQRPDDRFFIVSGPDDKGNYSSEPRDHAQLVDAFTQEQRSICGSLLSSSDWMVIRQMETGTAIPEDWAAYRAACRAVCTTRIEQLAGTTSTEGLQTLVNAPATVTGPRGQMAVVNPDPFLELWPAQPGEEVQEVPTVEEVQEAVGAAVDEAKTKAKKAVVSRRLKKK